MRKPSFRTVRCAVAVRQSSVNTAPVVVPKLVTDPIWSLDSWPVIVTFAGQEFQSPPLRALEWLEILMTGAEALDPNTFVEHIFSAEDAEEILDLLWNGELEIEEFNDIVLELIGEVSGRPWWVAMKLVSAARENWDLLGAELMLEGIKATEVSLSAWLDVVLLLILRNIDPEKATMFTSQLEMPPPGVEMKPEEMEMSAQQFLSMG